MKQQNFEHHAAIDPKFLTAGIIWLLSTICVIAVILSMVIATSTWSLEKYINPAIIFSIIILWFVVLPIMWLMITRMYSTKLQDRIIRQEVQFRHFVATWKQIDPRITIKQMIALRFAGDDEFFELCNKAAEQNLDPKVIKSMIKERKADNVRV